MKRFHYFRALVLGMAILASCAKNEPANTDATDGEKNFVISISGLAGRATDPDPSFTTATQEVDNLLVLLTGSDDEIIRKVEIDPADNPDDWDAITGTEGLLIPNVGSGVTAVIVYGNYKRTIVSTTTTFITGDVGDEITEAATIDKQQGAAVLYKGSESLSGATPGVVVSPTTGATINTYTLTVEIAPVVARIQVKSVTFLTASTEEVTNEAGTATVEWSAFDGDLVGVYLNNFYNAWPVLAAATTEKNTTYVDRITEGEWLFGDLAGTPVDAAEYASYNLWDGSDYVPYDLTAFNGDATTSFGFNFFPGASKPFLHFDLIGLAANLDSDDIAVYNPQLLPQAKFLNVIDYKQGTDPVVFEPGKIYNIDIEVKPCFTHADLAPVFYNIVLTVEIVPWDVEEIEPVYQQ